MAPKQSARKRPAAAMRRPAAAMRRPAAALLKRPATARKARAAATAADVEMATPEETGGAPAAKTATEGSEASTGKRKIPQPFEHSLANEPGQGWLIGTKVAQSNIPGAGNGRFATEAVAFDPDAALPRSILEKRLLPMSSLHTLVGLPLDATITFSSEEDLEKYGDLMKSEGGYSQEEVLHVFEHYVHGFDQEVCLLNVSSCTVNHSDSSETGLNGKFAFKDVDLQVAVGDREVQVKRVMVAEVLKDIADGDELFFDYRTFVIPEFYREFCKRRGFQDVRTATLAAVYGTS